jgi:hypothetical protein
MNVLSRGGQSADKVVRKLNFDNVEDSPEDKLKKIAQKHLGDEDTPTPQFNQMISRASGSNDPPQPPTTLDTNTDPNYWKTKNKDTY